MKKMGFQTKRNNKKGGLMDLHTFRFEGLYLTGFSLVVEVRNT
jgi:hypothetical protein